MFIFPGWQDMTDITRWMRETYRSMKGSGTNSTKNIKFLHKKEGVLQLDVEILNITREIRLYNTTHSHLVDDF